jgi:DNA polymerase III epsilon subunit-like protein
MAAAATYKSPTLFLFLDTETNGLPRDFKIPPVHHQFWPEILSIAWELWSYDNSRAKHWQLEDRQYFLIKPTPTIKWCAEAESIHKISLTQAVSDGHNISDVFPLFDIALARSDKIVAHNLSFDKSVIIAAMHRSNRKNIWIHTGSEICSMMSTIDIVRIPRSKPVKEDRYKWPKLSELHNFLFNCEYNGGDLHNSLVDTQCLAKCFMELLNRGLLAL